jgi:predicted phage terminase large subunit-like protein
VDVEAISSWQSRYVPVELTPKQLAFLLVPNREAFYGGAAGGGKSVALLAAALQYVDVPGYAALLIRRTYGELTQPNGLIDLSKQWLPGTGAVWREADYTWRFPSGATLRFHHLGDTRSSLAFQGGEYQFIGVDEVTDIEDENIYRFLFSRLRGKAGSTVPLRMRSASNPIGPGAEWVYQRFIVEGPSRGRIYIPARFEDNPHLDLESYDENLGELDPAMRQQLRYGDWEQRPEGTLFKRAWFTGSVVDVPHIPVGLHLCRYWDLAATEEGRGSDPDYTAGVLLGRDRDGLWYVIDVVRERLTPLGVQKLITQTAQRDRQLAFHHDWREPKIRMEQEPGSAGKAMIDSYSRLTLAPYDFKGLTSSGSKEVRAAPVSARAEDGLIRLRRAPWNGPFLDELCAFPQARHDDQVDALAGAYGVLAEIEGTGRARVKRINFYADRNMRVRPRRRSP